ncbi:hypothetical protein P6U16_24765 (plasmid) [Rhizobium sp. 32-5/1]|uniref:hypothetical protein n=1 Tax=Rhizobium sp. 32-5/1 TaxID=3019602 RepID=UPI00240DC547|nr:hypothetical protein [Rhizobium sp. 32-5/1]WEZ85350.1 hypothetical protein P6U16_24765 [Rhizobium sp. 32-5/1]
MTASISLYPSDRLLAFLFAVIVVATLVVAAEAHAFCSTFCIHGDRMIVTDICSGRG